MASDPQPRRASIDDVVAFTNASLGRTPKPPVAEPNRAAIRNRRRLDHQILTGDLATLHREICARAVAMSRGYAYLPRMMVGAGSGRLVGQPHVAADRARRAAVHRLDQLDPDQPLTTPSR